MSWLQPTEFEQKIYWKRLDTLIGRFGVDVQEICRRKQISRWELFLDLTFDAREEYDYEWGAVLYRKLREHYELSDIGGLPIGLWEETGKRLFDEIIPGSLCALADHIEQGNPR